MEDQAMHRERRDRFAKEIGNGLAVIPAAHQAIRNHDVEHAFRQDSDFHYLTGFDEPDAVAVLQPGHPTERYVLFVRPRDRDAEVWTGHRAGVEGAVDRYGADAAYPLSEFDAKLRSYALAAEALYYRMGDAGYDPRVTQLLGQLRSYRARYGTGVASNVRDPTPILHELRLQKSAAEIALLRTACAVSADGHREAMRFTRPGLPEHAVQAALEYIFRARGSRRNGYESIVASGANACILHYVDNDRVMEDGDLLLIDAGAEYDYYSADITRTFPVNGRFSGPQRALYEVVLLAERDAIAAARPGSDLRVVHETARRVIVAGLIDLGLLPGNVADSLAMHHEREFYYHGTSHWLGLDVHDAGAYRLDGEHRSLAPGMTFTVEPGIYVAADKETVTLHLLEHDFYDEWLPRRFELGTAAAKAIEQKALDAVEKIVHPVPEEFRGIGIRIEDDILITAGGNENLTAGVPVAVDDIEALCAEAPRLPEMGLLAQ